MWLLSEGKNLRFSCTQNKEMYSASPQMPQPQLSCWTGCICWPTGRQQEKTQEFHSLITTPPPETSKYHSHSEDYTEDPATIWTTLEMRAITVLHQWSQIFGQLMKEEKGSIELDGNTKQFEENPPWSSTNRLEIMLLTLQPFKVPLEVGYGERGWESRETNY